MKLFCPVDAQIQLNSSDATYTPGSVVSGQLIVTNAKPTVIRGIDARVTSAITFRGDRNAPSDRFSDSNQCSNESAADVKVRLGRADHGSGSVEPSAESVPEAHDIQPSSRCNRHTQRESRHYLNWKICEQSVLKETQSLTAGIHKYDFSIKIAELYEGVPLLPTIEDHYDCLDVEYKLQLMLKLPTPVLNSLSTPYKFACPITIRQRPTANDLSLASTVDERVATVNVGFWGPESSGILSTVGYYVGVDTARSWHQIEVKVVFPLQIPIYGEPYYLQEKFRISAKALGDLPNPILLDSLDMTLVSEIRYRESYRDSSAERSKKIFSFKSGSRSVILADETDLTSFISGATIPENLYPTAECGTILISHRLRIRISFRSQAFDKTSQSPAKAQLWIPLRLSASPKEEPQELI